MTDLRVPLPPELENFRADLEYFVSTMVRKLHTNRHKGDARNLDPKRMLDLALKEINDEVYSAWETEGQFEFAVECVDVANFLFLAARGAWHMTREQYDAERKSKSISKSNEY